MLLTLLVACQLDLCSSASADSACVQQGFAGEECRRAGPARYMQFRLSLLQQNSLTTHRHQVSSSVVGGGVVKRDGERTNSFVEVIHNRGDPPGMGFWFYYARGSGVYFNVGCAILPQRASRHVQAFPIGTGTGTGTRTGGRHVDCAHTRIAQHSLDTYTWRDAPSLLSCLPPSSPDSPWCALRLPATVFTFQHVDGAGELSPSTRTATPLPILPSGCSDRTSAPAERRIGCCRAT